jgi:putative ABC transport system ATP-binding protein
VINLLHDLAKTHGCAILMVTHDNRILDIADRILTLEDGHLCSYTSGLLANTGHLLTAFVEMQRRGELQRQVSQLNDRQFTTLLERTSSEFELVLQTFDIANQKATAALLDEILEALALKISGLIGAERATVYLVDSRRGLLWSKFAQSDADGQLKLTIPIDKGIAGRVARTGELLNVSDPYHHPDFYFDIDVRTAYRTSSVLSAPVRDRQGGIFGVVQLLNKVGGESFSTRDEIQLRDFAASVAPVLEICHCLQQTELRGIDTISTPAKHFHD